MYQKVGCIKNLEITSLCNLKCPYCPQRLQHLYRPVGMMSEEVFAKSLEWLAVFVKNGTQRELNFFGVGESLLHPRFFEYLERTREVMPRYLPLIMNTNGLLVDDHYVKEVMRIGIDKVDITDHEARSAMNAIRLFKKYGIRWGYSRDGILQPNNWGGLIDWVSEVTHNKYLCPWLSSGQVIIQSDGNVSRCCQDAFARGVICTVWDDVTSFDHTPFVQCRTCHELMPPGMAFNDVNTNPTAVCEPEMKAKEKKAS